MLIPEGREEACAVNCLFWRWFARCFFPFPPGERAPGVYALPDSVCQEGAHGCERLVNLPLTDCPLVLMDAEFAPFAPRQ